MAVCSKGLLEIRIYIGNQVAIYLTDIHTVNQDNQYNSWSMSEDSGIYVYLIITCTWVNMQNHPIRAYVIILKAAVRK